MDSEELNLVIRCGFEKDNLIRQLDSVNNIVGVLDPEEYDYDKSINNFQYLCKRALAWCMVQMQLLNANLLFRPGFTELAKST